MHQTVLPDPRSDRRPADRGMTAPVIGFVLVWLAGLGLVVGVDELDPGLGIVIGLVAAYVAATGLLLRRLGAEYDPVAAVLASAGPMIFVGAAFSGPPEGASEAGYLGNTAVLLVESVILLAGFVHLALRHRRSPYLGSMATVGVLYVIAFGAWIINLVSRFGIVLAGAAEQQAAVEDKAWWANEYLRGLPDGTDFLSVILVWFDLLQLGYVAVTFVLVARFARLLAADGAIGARAGARISAIGWVLAALLLGSATLAVALPHSADAVPANIAFVFCIPFMTTVLPLALGLAMLVRTRGRGNGAP